MTAETSANGNLYSVTVNQGSQVRIKICLSHLGYSVHHKGVPETVKTPLLEAVLGLRRQIANDSETVETVAEFARDSADLHDLASSLMSAWSSGIQPRKP